MTHPIRALLIPFAAVAVGVASLPEASAEAGARLIVTVENIRKPEGVMRIAVYATEADYDAGRATAANEARVSGAETASFELGALAPGAYAVKMFHDVDGDGRLNTGLFGVPGEPYGFSNNAPARFGPAKWADARFEVAGEPLSIRIRLN